ncbi:carbohydrate binding domain-containing protein [Candidatus Poribacteria bacterium]
MIRNGEFELDTDEDGMADHWNFSGDQGVAATWARDQGFIGEFSQKLTCTQFTSLSPASHVMLCQINTVQLEKGKWYKISFAARQEGIRSRAIQLAISNMKIWSNCGLQESLRAPREWKQFEFVFQASQTISEDVRLQFWYNTTGTLWLDNVQLEPSGPVVKRYTDVLPATDAVNLLYNSSFECGTSGWGSIADLPGWGGNLNLLVGSVDTTTAQQGRSSFKIVLTPETISTFYFDYFPLYRAPVTAPLLASRGWITVEPGVDYTLSAYMKIGDIIRGAHVRKSVGILSVRQAFRGTLRKEVRLTDQWERHTFTFQPQVDQIFIALGMDLEASGLEAGTVWIDRLQLEKGSEATDYRPRATVEVGLETDQPGNLFPYGVEPEMSAILSNADEVPHSVVLNLKTTDFDDAVVRESKQRINVLPGQTLRVPIRPDVQRKGFYRLHLSAEGAEMIHTRPLRFAIIEPYTESDSLFGMNHAYPWPHLLDLSKQMGLRWFRDWSLKWHDVEKDKGTFDFTEADHQIDRVLEQGLNVLPLLPFPSSNWSSSAGPEVETTERYPGSRERIAYMPRDMDEFANYVRITVQNHKDRLHVWEILNEPIYTDYSLPKTKGYKAADYVQLLQVAYQAVKETDPDALVIGGIAGGPTTYTKEFIEAGGLKWVDAFNLHTYPGLAMPESYEEPLRLLREKMQSVGADKPIWFTEGAYYADDDMPFEPYDAWLKPLDSEAEAAEWQVKFNAILLAYGVEKIIYHSGTPGSLNNESLSGIFFEWAGEPRKMLVTQSVMANLLPASVNSFGRLDAPENVRAYGFETDEQTVIVAWAEEYTETEVSLAGKPWRVLDLQGNELNADSITLKERPVYFIAEGKKLNKLPWREE